MTSDEEQVIATPLGKPLSKRALLLRLVLAEALARPGEGPLAPRFPLPARRSPVRDASEK